MKRKTLKQALYRKENPFFTGDTFYNRYVSSGIMEIVKNGNFEVMHLTGFTSAELDLIKKHAQAALWEVENPK